MKSNIVLKKIYIVIAAVIAVISVVNLSTSKIYASTITTLTPDTFKSVVSPSSGIVVVDFSSNGCGACQNLSSSGLLNKLADSYGDSKVRVAEITAASFSAADIKAITTNLGVTGVQSFPTIKIFVNGVDKGDLSNDTSNKNLISAWQNTLSTYTGGDAGSAGGSVPTTIANPPDVNHQCHLVLVTITDTDKKNITDCNNIDFTTYVNAVLDQLIPLILIVALIMIVYSGFQYMMSGIAGDTKLAKTRITGILGGLIFFFLIRLILNQIAPNINLDPTQDQVIADAASVCTLQDEPPDGGGTAYAPKSTVGMWASIFGVQVANAQAVTVNHKCFELSGNGGSGYNGIPMKKQLLYLNVPYPHYNGSDCNGEACSIGSSGCGIVSSAMVLEFYGHSISVPDLAKYALDNGFRYDGGTMPGYFASIATHEGLQSQVLNSWSEIKTHLILKQPVIVSGIGATPFTKHGHYIVLTGYSNGNVYVNDPWGGTERDNQSYSEDLIHSEYNDGHAFLFHK